MTSLSKASLPKAAARLVFVPQVHHLTLDVDATLETLYTTRFDGPASRITDEGDGTVTITRRGAMHPFDLARRSAHVTLSPDAAWDIEIRGVATHVQADLTGLPLRSITITGGMSDVRIVLPHTDHVVPVHFASGVRKTTLLRPVSTRATLRGDRGFTSLSLDGRWVGTLVEADWQSAEPPETTPGCYDITLASGSNHLTIA
ncbi:hypothetical protein [Kitasatospora sp. MAP5-34]|uniref:hypothetical protein n=1 Tax=Kitasatospora sp. MAP5-34 TaxID=3035102 RepID=UPI0024747CC1|nr:hypothetical protein [Kitasatospora sp. MAP5-34]MDH6579486.1 hypothetical protein [Kitasatospora sp. MAP5-34]